MSGDSFTVDVQAPERLSMSFIRASEGCLRRAHHEREVDIAGEAAVIGRIWHDVADAVGFRCSIEGKETLPKDDILAIAHRTLASAEDPVSESVTSEVLALVELWVPRAHFHPEEQFEVNSRIELAGRTLSARIDRLRIEGDTAHVRDYKTGWGGVPSELPVQGKVYGWHVFASHPQVERVLYSEEHVRFGANGEAGPFEIFRADNERTEQFLREAIARIDKAYGAGELKPTPGSACSSPTRCPVAGSCPIAEWARPATFVQTDEEAIEQFEAMLTEEARLDERKSALRGYIEHKGIRALQHNGQEIGFAQSGGKRFDKKALASALRERGDGLDLTTFEKPTNPSFGRRKAK